MRIDDIGRMVLLCATFFILSFLTSCKQEDDTIEIVPARHWVDRTVAVVAPLSDVATRSRLERTAAWFIDNFHEAQRHDTLAVRLHIEWHDELNEDLATLSTTLAGRGDIMAIIGPFANENVATFAPACKNTQKSLIVPATTSEEIVRRYAITTSGLNINNKPFLWSLTETDVSLTSLLMSSYATMCQYYKNLLPSRAMFFAPDNEHGKTFNYWAPFYAEEDEIELLSNELYSSSEDLLARIEAQRANIKSQSAFMSTATFCVAETAQQLYDVARANRKSVLSDPDLSNILQSTDPDDPVNDSWWQLFRRAFLTYFAFADLSEESIAALGPRAAAMLQGYEGFSPYADPTTGFELSYNNRFGVLPTFAECKFYDALMLAAFAACYVEHHPREGDGNACFNDAIVTITSTADNALEGSAWDIVPMQLYLSAMENGQLYHFMGASGEIMFDTDTYTCATSTTYVHWQLMDGKIYHRSYFGSKGGKRITNAKAAWLYIYNEQRASDDFKKQAAEGDTQQIVYPALTDQYAVLVQGSEGFINYRHQADVLSVYQSLRRGGFPDDHIILILDKQLASDPKNPEPGVIRTSTTGPDLLSGSTADSGFPAAIVDYDSADLTASDVADILAGRQTDRLPVVVPQGKGNNVLLYWSGHGRSMSHGGANEFSWRDAGSGKGFSADLLRQTAEQMQYRKLLVAVEPCYGECVIRAVEGIPGVLAMSGANSQEQSWADNWNDAAKVWMCDRFTKNLVTCLTKNPDTRFRDLFLYCAQHTLGSHARIVNAAHFGNLYVTTPAEFIRYN